MASARHNRKRRRNRGRLGLLFKLLCAVTAVAALTMGATVFFQVEQVQVNGNVRYTQEEIVAASGIQLGDNLYRLNKNQISGQIRRTLPYIEGANIRRSLPSTIVINVNELGAAACIAVPPPYVPDMPDGSAGSQDSPDQSAEPLPQAATQPWLISSKGKLLEPAGPDSTAVHVSGITPLDAAPGTMLKVPPEEEMLLQAMMELLGALEEQSLTQNVSSIELHSTWMDLRWLDRFDVRMPVGADYRYKLNVLTEVVSRTTQKHGEQATGTIDLTREDCDAGYSPD